MQTKLILVDLDGTLVCTKDCNFHAYKEAFNKYGFDLNYDFFLSECFGKSFNDFGRLVLKNDLTHFEKIHFHKKNVYKNYFGESKLNHHLCNLLKAMKENTKVVLVTTASKKNAYEILEFHNLISLFDEILTAEDVVKIKPDPEGYLKVMKKFDISPENTLIFEDSEVGLIAARSTKASVLAINKL